MFNRSRLRQTVVLAGCVWCISLVLCGSNLPNGWPAVGFPTAMAIESVKAESTDQIDDQRSPVTRQRLREGSRIRSSVGRFSRVGRRWTFEVEPTSAKADANGVVAASPATQPPDVSAASTKFQVLENLALQRIADAVSQDPNDLRWIVTGVVTEFSGENWLLLSTVFRAPSKTDAEVSK